MKKIPAKLLRSRYRKNLWKEAVEVINNLEKIVPISGLYLMGSYATKKKKPADIDFIVLLKTKSKQKKQFALDFVIIPDNKHGSKIMKETKNWMKQRYGEGKFDFLELK